MLTVTSTATTILDDYQRLGWKNNDPLTQTLQLLERTPHALGELVTGFIDRSLTPATFIDAALDLMDDATFADTTRHAWRQVLHGISSPALTQVLEAAALQHPQLFTGEWATLLALQRPQANPRQIDARHAWHALDTATLAAWRARLASAPEDVEPQPTQRELAKALLYSRNPESVLFAWRHFFTRVRTDIDAEAWLWEAGYALDDGHLRPLHCERPLHLGFAPKQHARMLAAQPEWKRDIWRHHPTWNRPATAVTTARMGGSLTQACGLCHGPLRRLLALPQPMLAGIASEAPLELATCLSCQGWEEAVLYYRHDAHGNPQAHPCQRRQQPLPPQFNEEALMEAEVALFQAPARWQRQDWGASNDRQNLNRVGGAPSWVQSADYPACADCQQPMAFAMQLDSNLPTATGEFFWGSGGCNYSYWCAPCRVSAHQWQCT